MKTTSSASSSKTQTARKAEGKWPAWHATLPTYRKPSALTAGWQLLNTLLPYCGLT
jgi:hypothetical protein